MSSASGTSRTAPHLCLGASRSPAPPRLRPGFAAAAFGKLRLPAGHVGGGGWSRRCWLLWSVSNGGRVASYQSPRCASEASESPHAGADSSKMEAAPCWDSGSADPTCEDCRSRSGSTPRRPLSLAGLFISGLASGREDRLAARAVQRSGEKLSGADSRCWTNRSSPPFTEKL